jgi:hypothetical protein
MPEQKPTPATTPSKELLLAAIDRAYRQRRHPGADGVSLAAIKEHLGLPHNGATTIRLRPLWQQLEAEQLIAHERRKGKDTWRLAGAGQMHLATTGAHGLPESPQHTRWREARTAASQRITGFQGELRGALDEAIALLEADHEADSATWFALSERLRQAGRMFASSTYCLREWPEPDESCADMDEPPHEQRHRRSFRGWDSKFGF